MTLDAHLEGMQLAHGWELSDLVDRRETGARQHTQTHSLVEFEQYSLSLLRR